MDEAPVQADDSETQRFNSSAERGQSERPDIDIEALAERVYRLMMAEIRLDRARGLLSNDSGG